MSKGMKQQQANHIYKLLIKLEESKDFVFCHQDFIN